MELQTLTIGDEITYGETVVGTVQKSVDYRIKELKQKLVNGTITAEEREELSLLK